MDTNPNITLLFKDEVFRIAGCAMDVLNELGHGFHEKPYENALVVAFTIQNIPFTQQTGYDLLYRGHRVGQFIPDLIAFNTVIVDTKVIIESPTSKGDKC